MSKSNTPKTVQAIVYSRDNIHQVFNFMESKTGKHNSTFLRYDPKANEYFLIKRDSNGFEKSKTQLYKGCLIVFTGEEFKAIYLEIETGGVSYEKN